MPSENGMGFFCLNCLPARVTGKFSLSTLNEETAARGGRIFYKDTDSRRSSQIFKKVNKPFSRYGEFSKIVITGKISWVALKPEANFSSIVF